MLKDIVFNNYYDRFCIPKPEKNYYSNELFDLFLHCDENNEYFKSKGKSYI